MDLTSDRPVRLDRLAHAMTAFVDLNYLRLPDDGSLFDEAWTAEREDALSSFVSYLDDDEDDDAEEVERALAWVLNLPGERFVDTVRRLKVPYPRFDPTDIRRFLELLRARSAGDDWRVDGFAPDAYRLVW